VFDGVVDPHHKDDDVGRVSERKGGGNSGCVGRVDVDTSGCSSPCIAVDGGNSLGDSGNAVIPRVALLVTCVMRITRVCVYSGMGLEKEQWSSQAILGPSHIRPHSRYQTRT